MDALRILNEDYSKTNPEFPNPPRNTFTNVAGNPNLEFCLASVDENGDPTTGITRTSTSKTNFDPDSESNDMKQNSTGGKDGWDPSKYLNIWICDLSTTSGGGMVLGYAYLPGLPSWNAWRDGQLIFNILELLALLHLVAMEELLRMKLVIIWVLIWHIC